VDRNLIRMALYEMLHVPDVPYRVAINEAVELAKEYGSTESRRFVNGVLGALVRKLNLDKTQRKRG
jgi:N utilization substance protein B